MNFEKTLIAEREKQSEEHTKYYQQKIKQAMEEVDLRKELLWATQQGHDGFIWMPRNRHVERIINGSWMYFLDQIERNVGMPRYYYYIENCLYYLKMPVLVYRYFR